MKTPPSIVMIGAPNSGTSIAAKLYQMLGWNFQESHEVQAKFMHFGWLSRASQVCARTDDAEKIAEARREVRDGFEAAAKPAIAKQHNLSWCLNKFTDIFQDIEPTITLVLNEKAIHLVRRSTHLRRKHDDHDLGWMKQSIAAWMRAAREQYNLWPGPKHVLQQAEIARAVLAHSTSGLLRALGVQEYSIDNETVHAAMRLFDPTRDQEDNPHRGLDGWEYPSCL